MYKLHTISLVELHTATTATLRKPDDTDHFYVLPS